MPAHSTQHGEVTLAYDVFEPTGRDDADTLLLIMGINMRSAHWGEHFIEGLRAHYRVVTFDNRGTGYSTKPVEEITAALWAADALAVLDAVGATRAHVLGFSMGGRVAQELAVKHAERVQRLILLSSAVGGPDAVPPTQEAIASFIPVPGKSPEAMRRDGMRVVTGPGFPEREPARFETLVALGATKRTPLSVLQKQIAVAQQPLVDALPAVEHPTRIIHGQADSLVPFGNGELLARLMPHAELVPLPGIGHLPSWEAPEALLDAITGFLG